MPRTLAARGGDVNVPKVPLRTSCAVSALTAALRTKDFTVRSPPRRFHVGYGRAQMCLTGRRGGSEPPARRPVGTSACAVELKEVEPTAAAVHRVHDAVR